MKVKGMKLGDFELELHGTDKSLKNVLTIIKSLHTILKFQNKDSTDGVHGGACINYNLGIQVREEWW